MPVIRQLDVDEAARLFRVQPATIRRRLARKELTPARTTSGVVMVRLSPAETWLRVEDAAALLGVSPATVRADIRRGRLTGRRLEAGRWRVLLRSVLEDRRAEPELVALFDVAPPPPAEAEPTSRRHVLHRQVYARLEPEEVGLLDRAIDRYGTMRAAVVAGLRAIDNEDPDVDVPEIRQERDLFEEQLGRVRAAHRSLSARAEGRLVDELYCHRCEALVPIEECGFVETPEGVEVFHEKHGHRSGSRFRSNTVIARRANIALDAPAN